MRIETERNAAQAMNIAPVHIIKEFGVAPTPGRPKFAISMEKKIEHLWLESEARGWRFSEFATAVMEALTVLHHRNKVRSRNARREAAPIKKIA